MDAVFGEPMVEYQPLFFAWPMCPFQENWLRVIRFAW
jgi:hypothetical protein